MAKGTFRLVTDPNDPIFSGGLVVSSPKYKADLTPSTPSSPTNTDGPVPPAQTSANSLSPEERFPDLNNLPIDPIRAFRKDVEDYRKKKG